MIKGYQGEIMKIYEAIRQNEAKALEKRKLEIGEKLPQILAIEHEIGKLCIDVSIHAFKDVENRDHYLNTLKEKITDLRIRKSELLVSNGYPMDYLSLNYTCPKCEDTGYIGTVKCSCYNRHLVKLYYKDSELNETLMINNFKNFKLEYYDFHKENKSLESPRKNIEKILEKSHRYIQEFNYSDENLLFYGNSGTGKTFLSHCIAKELLDAGYLVVYRTAEDLIKDLKDIKFNNDFNIQNLIINCDLLIIDDLGTEQMNDFSKNRIF